VGVASVGADARRLFCARNRRVARRAIARILPGEERQDHGAGACTPRFRSQEADERGAVNPYENLTRKLILLVGPFSPVTLVTTS
jgi:hypothetical protein